MKELPYEQDEVVTYVGSRRHVVVEVTEFCPICSQRLDAYHYCYIEDLIPCGTVELDLTSNGTYNYLAQDCDGDWWYFRYHADYDVDKLTTDTPKPVSVERAGQLIDAAIEDCQAGVDQLEERIITLRLAQP